MKPDRLGRPEARRLADEEFRRFAELTASLTSRDWAMQTDCTAWDVRKTALHVLGSADAQASVREFAHQMRKGMPLNKEVDSHHWVDGLNELQIRERDHLSTSELVKQLTAVGPKAVKGRWRTPPPMRYLPIPFGPPIGWKPLKYLLDVGFTRDVWCHRIDICGATGDRWTSPPIMTAAWLPTSWPNGPTSTLSPSTWSSKARPGGSSPRASTANESRSTPSTSSAPFPVASQAPASSAIPSLSKETLREYPHQRNRRPHLPAVHLRA